MVRDRHHEGLRAARLLMVLSSMSPIFVLWAIRGNKLMRDRYWLAFCAVMVVVPYLFLWLRIRTAKRLQEKREIVVGSAEDRRDHLLVYLFALLLPVYAVDFGELRDSLAILTALAFIVFLFWRLNLHYINIGFAALGYGVFTVSPPRDENPLTGKVSQVLITKRVTLSAGDHVVAYRLSDTVYLEV